MKFSLLLLKQLFFIVFGILWEVIKNIWQPIYTTTVKTLLIASVIFCICKFIPHHIQYLHDVSFLGWIVVILVYRLLNVKYDDFDDEKEAVETTPTPQYLEDEENLNEDIPPPPPNSLKASRIANDDRNSSTRE